MNLGRSSSPLRNLPIQDTMVYAAVVLLAVGGTVVLLMADHIYDSPAYHARLIFAFTMLIAAASSYVLGRLGWRTAAAALVVSTIWLGVTVYSFVTGFGLRTTVVSIYAPTLLYTAFVLGARAAILQTVMTLAAVFAMYLAEDSGRIGGITAVLAGTTGFNLFLGIALAVLATLVVGLTYWYTAQRAADQLEASHRELQALNESLERRVAARTVELQEKVHELEAFNYSVAHDLRAPLRAINAAAALIRDAMGEALDAASRDNLARIGAQTLHLDTLLMALLELARLGREPCAREAVDLSALADELAARFIASPQGVRADFSIEPGLAAQGDPALLEAVLRVLFENALKFSATRERVQIEFGRSPTGGGGAYFVRDNGVGFNQQHARQLFRPFHRLHGETEYEGIGIGLAVAQRIIRRHGGRIWATAMPGRGATFYFTLGA